MISQETFYKEVMENFRDLNSKIDHVTGKLDKVKDDVSTLCTKTTVLEHDYKGHVAEEIKKGEKKYKYISVIFAFVAGITAIYNTIFKN